MSVIKAIKSRNSGAIIGDEDVSPEIIRQILDAAVCTPVHLRTNPWRFLVIRGQGRHRLGEFMAQRLARDMAEPDSPKNARYLKKIAGKPLRAPVIIVAAAARSDNLRAIMREDVASVSAACQNILLAASELHLNAIWRTGDMTYDPAMVDFLGFEAGTELIGFIYLGHPSGKSAAKVRPTSEAFTRWLEE